MKKWVNTLQVQKIVFLITFISILIPSIAQVSFTFNHKSDLLISCTNTPPVAVNDSYTGSINHPLTISSPGILTNDTDAEGDPLSASLVSGPTNGSLTLSVDGSFTYTPNRCFSGTDSFTYKAFDGQLYSDPATVTIRVNPVLTNASTQAWVSRINGTGSNNDYATASVADNQGNVYVTGSVVNVGTFFDYQTAKFDQNGNLIWSRVYNGPSDDIDFANAITRDALGNIYVTGESTGLNGLDCTTIKYDSNGNQLWIKRFDGFGNSNDSGVVVTTDSQGNVYVAGYSNGGSSTNDNFLLLKYDTNGNQIWVRTYDDPTHGNDYIYSMVLDNQANIYVTGPSDSGINISDLATIKYDSNGNTIWIKRFSNPVNGYSDSNNQAIAVDNQGNVYVSGDCDTAANIHSCVTIKYNSLGSQLWVRFYNSTSSAKDVPVGLVLDTQANVYVTGYSNGVNTASDFETIKYDTNGNLVWVKRYNGINDTDDYSTSLAIDNQGSIYVSGYSYSSSALGSDCVTLKYDSNGNLVWLQTYDGPAHKDDVTYQLILDQSGNVYLACQSYGGATHDDFTVIKYTQSVLAPTANSDNYSVNTNTTLNIASPGVLSNDSDPGGNILTAQIVTNPSHGSFTLNSNGSFVYIPNMNYSGTDSFTYKVSNCVSDSLPAAVTINVMQPSSITFTGTVVLGGWTGPVLPKANITIDGVTYLVTLTPVSTNSGRFTLNLAQNAAHTVKVKPQGFLAKKFTFNAAASNVSYTFGSGIGLLSGDINDDNMVDDLDLLAVINNFLNPPPAGMFDANGDNVLNDIDLLSAINHFLMVGDN